MHNKSIFIVLLYALIIPAIKVSAQPMPYIFTQQTTGYTPLTGGSIFQSGTALDVNTVSPAIFLPWPFQFNGQTCDRIYLSNNGYITLANAATNVAPADNSYVAISGSGGYLGAVAGYAINLKSSTVSGATPAITYGEDGSDFVVQFTDLCRASIASDRMSFQIRLTRNTNTIKIIYNNWTSASTTTNLANFGQVGLRGASNSAYHARAVYPGVPYNTWLTSAGSSNNGSGESQAASISATGSGPNCMRFNSSYLPPSGLTYTWTPIPPTFYQSIPYHQNFETWGSLHSVNDVPGAGVIVTPSAGNLSVRANDESVANSIWGNIVGGTLANPGAAQGAKCGRFHSAASGAGAKGYLDCYVDLSPAGAKLMTFESINTAPTRPIHIHISTDGGLSFTGPIATVNVATTSWGVTSIALGAITSATTVIRFEFTADYNTDSDVGIDNISIDLDQSLPVTLITFEAQKLSDQGVLLSWETGTEENTDRFEIQRSSDGSNFQTILIKDATGNSLSSRKYQGVDYNPANGKNFYRLKMIDQNGQYAYSTIKSVDMRDGLTIRVSPNPASSYINIQHLPDNTVLNITNSDGALVYTGRTHAGVASIPITDLKTGIYYITIIENGRVILSNKFFKK